MRKTSLALLIGASLAASASAAQATDLWDIYQLAVQNDPSFLQAQANYQAAVEDKAIARGGYLPNITFNANRNRTNVKGDQIGVSNTTPPTIGLQNFTSTTYQTQYQFQLTQPIFNWAAWQAINQADAQVAQAEAQYTAAQEDLIQRTATAYFNVLNARDTLNADRAAEESNAKQLEQSKEKYDVGMSAITDVENAQAAYDQSAANVITAEQQVVTTEEQLRAITGQAAGELMEPSMDMPLRSPDPANAQQWVDQALKQNPNVLAAQSGVAVADANIGMKRANEYPSLNAIAQHNKINDTGNNVFDLSQTSGTFLELQLSFPIFSGGTVAAQVSQAQRQYDAAVDNVKLVSRQTEQQARTAYLGVLTGISQVQALKQSVKSNQTSMDATQTGMEVGTRTIVDVLTARQNLLTAQTGFSNARYTYLESLLQLKDAAGTLTEQDLKEINTLMAVKTPVADLSIPQMDSETPAAPASSLAAPAAAAPSAAPAAGTTAAPAASTKTPPRG